MKTIKYLLMLALASITISVNAQLEVGSGTSAGNIAVATSPSPLAYSKLGVNFSSSSGSGSNRNYVLTAGNTPINSTNLLYYGLQATSAFSSAQSMGQTFGVFGEAGNGQSGYNYGVSGELIGTTNGAAIYGVVGSFTQVTGGQWAGYFQGNVNINGSIYLNGTYYASDKRLKKNISPLTNSTINKISQLNAISYKFKTRQELHADGTIPVDTSKSDTVNGTLMNKVHFGFVAQDVQKLFPDLVYQKADGFLGVNYTEFIPIIIDALKQQDSIIANLQQQINTCCTKGSTQKTTGDNSADPSTDIELASKSAILYQNMPNPFGDGTVVKYFVPENVTSASIIFYDEFGNEIKNVELPNKGVTAVLNLSTLNLASGIYSYSLLVNGKVIDTKKMVKTK